MAASIRQHEIALSDGEPGHGNAVRATVVRGVFLGSARDYIVEVADGTQLRVTAPPEQAFAPGAVIWAHLPPARCRALAG